MSSANPEGLHRERVVGFGEVLGHPLPVIDTLERNVMTDAATPTRNEPSTKPNYVHVCADTTPGVHRTDSDEAHWWLPVLGPTAIVLAFTLARHTPRAGATWDTLTLAQRVGLGGNRSKLWISLNRLEQFGVAQFHATDVLTVRLWLPVLTERQLLRLPDDMAVDYRRSTIQTVTA